MTPTARRGVFAAVLAVQLLGSGGALLVAGRDWQTVTTSRPRPLRADVLEVTGRSVDAAPTAFALVALAGVVAVLATRGRLRRAVGVIVALAGAGIAWRAVVSAGPLGAARARSLVADRHPTVDVTNAVVGVQVHGVWPGLCVVSAVLVMLAGLVLTWRGHRLPALSARHERSGATGVDNRGDPASGVARDPASGSAGDSWSAGDAAGDSWSADADQARRARRTTQLWSALDRGDDPTR